MSLLIISAATFAQAALVLGIIPISRRLRVLLVDINTEELLDKPGMTSNPTMTVRFHI